MTSLLYVDAAQHPLENAKDTRSPALEEALRRLGFRALGQVHCIPQEKFPNPYVELRDQVEYDALMKGDLSTVMVSAEGTAFAEPERSYDMDFLRFRSLLETGDIVETRLRPARNLPTKGIFADPEICQQARESEMANNIYLWVDRLLDRLIGKNDEGNYPNLAAAGLHRENLSDQSPEEIYRRHQERVANIARKLGTSVVDHNSLDLFLAVTRRGFHVQETYLNRVISGMFWFPLAMTAVLVALGLAFGWSLGLDVLFLGVLLGAGFFLFMFVERSGPERWPLTWSLGMLGSFVVAHALYLPVWPLLGGMAYFFFVLFFRELWCLLFEYRIAPPFIRRIPFPRRIPARELLVVYK